MAFNLSIVLNLSIVVAGAIAEWHECTYRTSVFILLRIKQLFASPLDSLDAPRRVKNVQIITRLSPTYEDDGAYQPAWLALKLA